MDNLSLNLNWDYSESLNQYKYFMNYNFDNYTSVCIGISIYREGGYYVEWYFPEEGFDIRCQDDIKAFNQFISDYNHDLKRILRKYDLS